MSGLFTSFYFSPLGVIQISSSGDAITSLLFVDKEKSTHNNAKTPKVLVDCTKQLDEYFLGKRKEFNVPTLQEGTLFQQAVWKELEKIPYGKTISYLDLAKRLGNAKTIRAAGTANGKNKLAIIVPCHRVIGSNGSLVGYSGGLKNKQWLLEHEARYNNGVQQLF